MLDTLTPLLILEAKSAAENAAQDAEEKKSPSLPFALSAALAVDKAVRSSACVASAVVGMGLFPFFFRLF